MSTITEIANTFVKSNRVLVAANNEEEIYQIWRKLQVFC